MSDNDPYAHDPGWQAGQPPAPPQPPAYPPPGPQPGQAYGPPGQPPGQGYGPPGQGYPPAGYSYYAPPPPKHPRATTALVLGIVAVAGGMMCYLPAALGPFAWYIGAKARREIAEANGGQSGEGESLTGMILGIVGTVLLALFILLLAFIIVMVALEASQPGWDEVTAAIGGPVAALF